MVAVVDYGMGNLRSVLNALNHIGADAELVDNASAVHRHERLILPGVGAFRDAMQEIEVRGFAEAIPRLAREGRPVLGVCLGMQLLADRSLENGDHAGLGLVPGTVERISPLGDLRVPHVGWNSIDVRSPGPLFNGLSEEPTFYFVHSYHLAPADPAHCSATAEYGGAITACVEHDGVYGAQFHPEKSQGDGLRLLENFVGLQC